MEFLRVVGPGGARDATDVTSATEVVFDLSALIGHYVTLTWDQAMYFSQVPATGTFTLDATANAVAAAKAPASGTLVPERVPRDTVVGLAQARDIYVSKDYPRLIMKAQGTTATYTEVKVTSLPRSQASG
jgi:hypothetical protein